MAQGGQMAPAIIPAAPPTPMHHEDPAIPPEFADFNIWAQKYNTAPAATRTAMLAEGISLAKIRREALRALISTDPKRALEFATPVRLRAMLPPEIMTLLEERISTRGEYAVLIASTIDAQIGERQANLSRMVNVGGLAYRASVYGRRLGTTTKTQMAFHGIALDRVLAVHESPVRLLELGERLPIDAPLGREGKRCPICRADSADGIVADVGGVFYFFDSDKDIQTFRARIETQEDILDPKANGLEKPLPVEAAR